MIESSRSIDSSTSRVVVENQIVRKIAKELPMKNGFKVIDSDMHIMEPVDLWDKYMDSRFKERGPRPVRVPTRGDLNLLLIEGKEPRQNSPTLAHDVRMISSKRNNTRGDVIDFA